MAKNDDSEEANFEPTPQKLRQLRDQGQIPRSQEFTGAFTLICVMGYVVVTHQWTIDALTLALAENPVFTSEPFEVRMMQSLRLMGVLSAQIVLPIIAIAIFSAIVAALLDIGGFMFSTQALAPNFNKFNPVEGFKNMFKLRSLIDLIKSAVKIVVFFACLTLIIRAFLNDAFWAPTCGVGCIFQVGQTVLLYIILVSAFLLVIFAAFDFVISRALFTRDNKMTLTEMKREMKEAFGDPHVRGQRDQIRKEMAETAGMVGPNAANLWIAGPEGMVGIAYKPEQSGVPIFAAKGLGENAAAMRARAAENGVAIAENPALFDALLREGRVGQPIPRDTFNDVAQALVQAGFSG
ncbi:MAG: EscU/YscU/HrcU family type III secretion system export apparatus switch protein [Salinarimonadaceae bacterium]|nr:MAG: EscU/YscU/HrcU family type III secretion system export apparatus switch protein [Salinarimonadaceae bacterium]